MLLKVNNLETIFRMARGEVRAVDRISFNIKSGKTLGLVGESGCGKSVTALSIMRLVPDPPGKIAGGSIELEGNDILKLPEKEMRKIRGNEISIVFQEPLSSLNPVFSCGEQVREAIVLHQHLGRKDSKTEAIEMLRKVRIPDPEIRYKNYPHQMSGGMRQRVMIAMALSCQPKLLIADEPTTALDVSVQAQIIELLQDLREELGMSILLITHDLAVIAQMADTVVVMYAGKIVEKAPAGKLFSDPSHPYTQGLLASMPGYSIPGKSLPVIPGSVPDPVKLPPGCRFSDRCGKRIEKCFNEEPPLFNLGDSHFSRCWLHNKEEN